MSIAFISHNAWEDDYELEDDEEEEMEYVEE